MKKPLKLFSLLLALLMGLCPIALCKAQIANATELSVVQTTDPSPRTNKFLLSPTLVSQSGEATFAYDAEVECIKAIQSGEIVLSVHMSQTPVAMQFAQNHLFVLFSSNVAAYSYSPKTENESATLTEVAIETGDISFPAAMSCFSIVPNLLNELELFVQFSNGTNIEIKKFITTYNSETNKFAISSETISTFHSPSLVNEETNAQGKITAFAVQKTIDGYKMICSDNTATYGLVCSPSSLQTCEVISSKSCTSICTFGENFVCAFGETVNQYNQSFEEIENSSTSFSANSIASFSNTLVATSSKNALITKLVPPEIQILFENEEITPEVNTNSLQFGSTSVPFLPLYEKPYSVSGIPVAANQSVIILSENGNGYEGFSYVSFATDTTENNYGYLPTEKIQKKQVTSSNYKAKAVTNISLFTIPSSVTDQTNKVVCSIAKNEEITVISNAANITNNGQTKFVQVQTQSGQVGFVQLSKISQIAETTTLKQVRANATTKRSTVLYETKSEDSAIFPLCEGTRIKIFGLLNPTTTYTKVQIEDSTGTVVTGYIKTADIKPDSITTLQLTGIIILSANALLLGAIIAFVAAAKKKRQQ